MLSLQDVDHFIFGVMIRTFLPELWPFVSLVRSCGCNSSFSFQLNFIKLSKYCCYYMKRLIFYLGHDLVLSARVTALSESNLVAAAFLV